MGVFYRATGRQILLNRRVMPVAFGHYAWLKDWTAETVKLAGSGVLIAPGLGLGAKHVSKSFERLDEGMEAAQRRVPIFAEQYLSRPMVTEYAGLLYQAPRIRMPSEKDIVYWGVFVDWPSPDTDISVLQAEPISPAAERIAAEGLEFLEWQLLPPQRGCEVDVYGFPNPNITVEKERHTQDIQFQSETVRITEVFDVLQAHGFTGFPGFTVNRDLAHGYSGSPVLYDGRLVGIFSGPNYVSSLWPLVLHEYPDKNDNPGVDLLKPGAIRKELKMRKIADMLESGAISAIDYAETRGRVRRLPCAEALDGGSIENRCDKQHVFLTR